MTIDRRATRRRLLDSVGVVQRWSGWVKDDAHHVAQHIAAPAAANTTVVLA